MRKLSRDRAMTLAFFALAFVVAFWQRPGRAFTDTKIDLHVDPGPFLAQVAAVWTQSTDLGEVHSSQYIGYLWPMGPVYAALHAIGSSAWVAQRIWLGLVLALAAWGTLRLMDEFVGRPRGIAHVVAAAVFTLNPYTTVFTARSTSALVGYVGLPWLLTVVARGLRATRGWRAIGSWWWPAAFALIVTSLGAGINGAVVGWMLVGPLVLLFYEPLIGGVRWRDSAGFLLRAGALSFVASLWWILPLLVQARYGVDFLPFTEPPRAIWNTNSSTEALRLMGYWTSYAGVGFYGVERALFSDVGTLLFNPFAVGASLLLPALAIAGFAATRRHRYAPFLLLVLLVGLVIEMAGFPLGTPARDAMEWAYRNSLIVRFMRTTQKAAPLVAIGISGLLGLAAQLAWSRLRRIEARRLRSVALIAAPLALAALIALSALPLVRGTAPDEQMTWKSIPSAWRQAGAGLDRELPANARAMVLPAQVFAFYTWGGTGDAIISRLTDRPVAVRYETPYSDPHASDLLATVDDLVQQERLLPGQLAPLLKLLGVRSVITGSDDDITRSGAVDPYSAAQQLDGQGLRAPRHRYGPTTRLAPARGDLGAPRALPQVRSYDVPAGRGLLEVMPTGPATVVDGSAGGLADLAAFGALPARAPILYAGDLTPAQIRDQAVAGAEIVVTDSSRRRQFQPTSAYQNTGRTLGAAELLGKDESLIDPFALRGSDAQTVAVLQGPASYVRAPEGSGPNPFPERSAIHAFDDDPSTVWAAARYLPPSDRWIEVGFRRPRDVPYVDLVPVRDWRGIERSVSINGVRANLGPGVTRVRTNLEHVTRLRITLTRVDQPMTTDLRGSGGFREIRIPGVRLREQYRTPVLTAKALAGSDLGRSGLTYLFERTTGDRPLRRDRVTDSPMIEQISNRADVEQQIDRVVFAPQARSYALDAWVAPSIDARDWQLDQLAGARLAARFDSSSRFQNQPRYRASSAFDDRAGSAWIGIWAPPSAALPWISFATRKPLLVRALTLSRAPGAVRRPTSVRVSWPGGSTPPLAVGAGGVVKLPRGVTARAFRITILAARFPAGTTTRARASRAVGLASVRVAGLDPAGVPTSGELRAPCGSVRAEVGAGVAQLRVQGTVADLDAGRALKAVGCGATSMGKDIQTIRTLPGAFSVNLLRLRSDAPDAPPAPAGGGRVVNAGTSANTSVKGARVALEGPSWLVLGQSYSNGWRATCDGRSLGAPLPINGYANGWRAPASCRAVAFEYEPQQLAQTGYLLSGIAAALLAALMLWGLVRGRHHPAPPRVGQLLADAPVASVGLVNAVAIALAVSVPMSLLFALRTWPFVFAGLTLILWRGLGPRALTMIAAALLGIVAPLIYAIVSPRDRGGYDFNYAIDLIWAHWTGVAGAVLLGVACWQTLASARRGRPRAGDESPRAGAETAG